MKLIPKYKKLVYEKLFLLTNLENDTEKQNCLRLLAAQIQTYPKNTIIYKHNDKLGKIFFLLEGQVHLVNDYYNGQKLIVETYNKADTFGFYFGDISNSLSFQSQTKIKVLILNLSNIDNEEANTHSIYKKICLEIQKNNSNLIRKITSLGYRKNKDKILAYFVSLYHMQNKLEDNTDKQNKQAKEDKQVKQNKKNKRGKKIILNNNRQDLADILGMHRSTLNREIKELQAENIIHFIEKNIILINDDVFEYFR